MGKEHTFTLIVRENRELSEDEKNDSDYPRHKLMSIILSFLIESNMNIKLKYVDTVEVEDSGQLELGMDQTEEL